MELPRTAFRVWRRRCDQSRTDALIGSTITLQEQVEYLFDFEVPLSRANQQRLRDLGGEFLKPNLAVLSFGNFVGRTDLAGVAIEVVSSKLGPGGTSRLLQDVSTLVSSLVFGWGSPTGFLAAANRDRLAPVPYHQFQFLRHKMRGAPIGQRLQDWLGVIERNPTRRFEPERPIVSPNRVRRLDNRAVQSIFSRLDRLAPVPPSAPIAANKLARKLTFGTPLRAHFPTKVAAPRGRLSFDTPENRFTRHVVSECLGLIYRFLDHPKIHEGLRADCRTMLVLLEQLASAPFLTEAGRLASFQAPSQALAKADGYRELFGFWSDLTSHVSLPKNGRETDHLYSKAGIWPRSMSIGYL